VDLAVVKYHTYDRNWCSDLFSFGKIIRYLIVDTTLGRYYFYNRYAVAFFVVFAVKTNRYAAAFLFPGPIESEMFLSIRVIT